MRFDVQRRNEDGTIRLVVRGELDIATGAKLDDALRSTEREHAGRLVLDLTGVTFFDSTGLQVLLDADVRARDAGRELVVSPGDGEVLRILRLAEVTDRLQLEGVA